MTNEITCIRIENTKGELLIKIKNGKKCIEVTKRADVVDFIARVYHKDKRVTTMKVAND